MKRPDEEWISNIDELLAWLDPDRERAANKYEEIRRSLIKIFVWNGCSDAESLADQTLNRVTAKLSWIQQNYQGTPSSYIHGVAKRVLSESLRHAKQSTDISAMLNRPEITNTGDTEKMLDCLERCLSTLDAKSRNVILGYYAESGSSGASARKNLARDLDMTITMLRLRVHHIRMHLVTCIKSCMEVEKAL